MFLVVFPAVIRGATNGPDDDDDDNSNKNFDVKIQLNYLHVLITVPILNLIINN